MATERQSPDAILELTNLTGTVTEIQDDPDAPDANWLDAASNNADSICRTSFPTPTGNPTVGADLQEFRVLVRKFGGTGTPTARIELYENGVLIRAGSENNVTGNLIISFTWNANEIGTPNGSLVECRLYGTKSGGAPTARATVEVGAVEWNVTYSAGVTHYGVATLAGLGALAGIGTLIISGLATLAGSGIVAAIGRLTYAAKATLSGIGTVTAIGRRTVYGIATLAGVGAVACIGTVGGIIHQGVATLSGVGNVIASAVTTFAGKAALAGSGALVAKGVMTLIGKTTISGVGTVSALGGFIRNGVATLSGIGNLSTIGGISAIILGQVSFAGNGVLSAILCLRGILLDITPNIMKLLNINSLLFNKATISSDISQGLKITRGFRDN